MAQGYMETEKWKDFSNYFEDVYEINERLEATKSFYNKYTTLLNAAIKKIPSNIIASFHHMKVKAYFDGKDMFDEEIKDFKAKYEKLKRNNNNGDNNE